MVKLKKNNYCLRVSKKTFEWYCEYLFTRSKYNTRLIFSAQLKIFDLGYDCQMFGKLPVTCFNIKGYEMIDLRRYKRDISKWMKRVLNLYEEV